MKILPLKLGVMDTSEETWIATRSWDSQGTHSPLELMERTQPWQHLAFSPVIQASDFQAPELGDEASHRLCGNLLWQPHEISKKASRSLAEN